MEIKEMLHKNFTRTSI